MSTQIFTEAWLAGPKATQFYTRTYTPANNSPPKAVVVFIHGFAEHIGRYTHFHPLLTSRGIAVFTYDQRGFGLTGQDTTGKKSKTSAYGKTSWKDQMLDIDWALGHAKKSFEGVPIFLMGHSMGGGEVLGFCTQGEKGPYKSTLGSISGVISTSPLIMTTTPAPKFQMWIGAKLSALLPATLIPVGVKAEQLSHDPEVNNAYLKDPLVKQSGSLKGVSDMLTHGEKVLQNDYINWPKSLPVLILHGTEDKVTSHKASETLQAKLPAESKKLSLYEGGFHELQNEPNGVKEKLADEIVAFIEEHLSKPSSAASAVPTETVQSPETPVEPIPPTEASVQPTGRGYGLTAQDTTERKSKASTYGKTSWKDQMLDIAWTLGHAKKYFEGMPIFLMGYSMGGGEVLGFCTQGMKGPSPLYSLSGIISTNTPEIPDMDCRHT
ncbi:hypothetical protein CVT25_013538 [Psilocybe cyanescens]|uniref:Serine aminopeptidase S33 domain-containing protein n=1 Tax=Psilocybe cyanescens TaxID=93625 RepID=A0A409XSN5_PSICY|nr:hypothetical protein CVT25_013538 [Psilocybe cyanescens]